MFHLPAILPQAQGWTDPFSAILLYPEMKTNHHILVYLNCVSWGVGVAKGVRAVSPLAVRQGPGDCKLETLKIVTPSLPALV